MDQLPLLTGYYRCDDCGALFERLRKTFRFRLCDACYERVVPVLPPGVTTVEHGSPEQQAVMRYAEWRAGMEKRHPGRSVKMLKCRVARARRKPLAPAQTTDDLYPLCACGRPREVSAIARATNGGGLFGGPFHKECAVCEARGQVERVTEFTAGTHPEWDDEDWLDHLWQVFPKTFEVGVLPDYWYELRRWLPVAAEKER